MLSLDDPLSLSLKVMATSHILKRLRCALKSSFCTILGPFERNLSRFTASNTFLLKHLNPELQSFTFSPSTIRMYWLASLVIAFLTIPLPISFPP